MKQMPHEELAYARDYWRAAGSLVGGAELTIEMHNRGGEEWPDRTLGGELNGALARAVVRIYRKHAGRGPTSAQAFFRDRFVVVVLQNVMTQLERSLARVGSDRALQALRRELHESMRPELVAAVEGLTDCTVTALMGDTSVEADIATEVLILDRPVDPQRAARARASRRFERDSDADRLRSH
jgi:uncharacterized protein YbcI